MPAAHFARSIVLFLCSALAAFGCASTDTGQGATGSLSLDLVLAGDIEIDVVDWQITGNGMDMGGSIDVSAPGSTASIEVYGLPVGQDPYMVELSAVSVDQQVTCRGTAEFDVEVGVSTPVMVILNCKLPQELGSVRVNGKLNICAQLTKMVVAPLQTSVGNDISLFSTASDEEGDPITYMWSSHSGSIADPIAASTTYTCTEAGDDEITILVTDDDGTYCMSMWTVRVTCVEGDANPCDDVICEDDGNECTDATCNPANGQCETSNNTNACDDGAGTCNAGVCEPNPECVEPADCPDTGNECIDPVCNAGVCETSNNTNACDGGNGTCDGQGVCVPNPECSVPEDCPETGNECIDPVCDAGVCGTSNNTNACEDGTGTCDGQGVCQANPECAVDEDCPATGNECIDPVCNAGVCETSNNTSACEGGTGTCNAGVCEPNEVCEYTQDFESLVQTDPDALANDGWLVGANVFESDGTTFVRNYFAFPAPNGGAAFSAIDAGQGGAAQGAQQMSIYNDYNNGDHAEGFIIEAIVFQERLVVAADMGNTISFTFDTKAGNIVSPTTAEAFIQVLRSSDNSFATLERDDVDTFIEPATWGTYTISVVIDASWVGETLQFGAQSRATNFESSGVFYDNMAVCSQ